MADLTITATSVIQGTGAETEQGTAGASITAGQPVYKDSTDSNKLKLCDGDVLLTAACVGISLHAAANGQPLLYQKRGILAIGATVAVGQAYYVSLTAGGICPFADLGSGDFPVKIAVGMTTSTVQVLIENPGIAI